MDTIETETVEQDGQIYRISIYPDGDTPNPLDEDWSELGTILSLNRRHANFDPAGVEAAIRNHLLEQRPELSRDLAAAA